MDKNERLSRIKTLLDEKKKEEDIFGLKIKQINEEIYSKQMNPLLINFLNFTSSSVEKLENTIKKAGGRFENRTDYKFTREQYEKGLNILETNGDINQFFQVFGAVFLNKVDSEDIYQFLEQVDEIIKDLEFTRKHSYLGQSIEQISFSKYLKVVYDDRIEILRKPLEHLNGIKIHGIWEVVNSGKDLSDGVVFKSESSYLLGHCTRSHTSCWPIISEGLKISKSAGGRCGRGIYFSNDLSKCLQYASFTDLGNSQKMSFGLIFFAQVYTGKIRQIRRDDGSLTRSNEYDCIHAVGTRSPKISIDIWHSDGTGSKIFIDEPSPTGESSSFLNNEFVIYDETRSRLRYILLISRTSGRYF